MGELDLETLKAFAVTTDRERQRAVWDEVQSQGYRAGGWQVRRMLTEDRVPATTASARFVGIEAYQAAGGAVTRDLFAAADDRGIWFDDPKLLHDLALAKLGAVTDELCTRWAWAEARIEVDWSATARFGRIAPEPGLPSEAEQAEIERLRTREDELTQLIDADWTEELVEEAEVIEARMEEINAAVESRTVFRREDYAIAGCIATIGNDGGLRLIQGLVKPEDMPAQTGGDGASDGHDAPGRLNRRGIAGPAAAPVDPRAQARQQAGVGIGLADDLRAIRTALIKAHLAEDFEAAFDLLIVPACAQRLYPRLLCPRPRHRKPRDAGPGPRYAATMMPSRAGAQARGCWPDRSGLAFDWLEQETDGAAFAALRALPAMAKQALFAASVARTVKGQLAFEPDARPELEATIARLGIDFAGQVRPTAELLWSRVRKDRDAGYRRCHPGRHLGVGAEQVQESRTGPGDGASLRGRGHAARRRHRGRTCGRAGLDAARVRTLRYRPAGRR